MLDPLSFSINLSSSVPRPVLPTRRLLTPSPNHPNDYILEVDNSSLESFCTCQKKAENYMVRSRQAAKDQSPQQFGRLFHSCEELRLRHGLSPEVVQRQRELCATHFLSHPVSPTDHRTQDRMITVLNAYNSHFAADQWPERVLLHEGEKFVERPFKVELCTIPVQSYLDYTPGDIVAGREGIRDRLYVSSLHIIWTGRIDAVLSDASGLWVVDHKTTSQGGREHEESFKLARQTVGYTWAATKLLARDDIRGCVINSVCIRAPAKTTRATLAREEFNRYTYFYSPDRLAEWEADTKTVLSDFVACLLRGHFPMTGPKSFRSPCTYCDYHENCQLPRSQRAADLSTDLYTDVTWTPIAND